MNRYLPIVLLVGLLLAFRLLGAAYPDTLQNFTPLAAVFFLGAMLAKGWRGFAIPLAVWAVTFPLGTGHTGSPALFLVTLLAFAAIFFLGKALVGKGVGTMLLGSVGAAIMFHCLTGSFSWIADPNYTKSLSGLWAALWTGAPYPLPSWVFLRNMAAANLLFTGLYFAAGFRLPQVQAALPKPALAKSR